MSEASHTESQSGAGQQVVLPHALVLINQFCDMDEEFIKNERFLDSLIFGESNVPWSIYWGHMDDFVRTTGSTVGADPVLAHETLAPPSKIKGGPYRPEWCNSDDMRRKFHTFLSRALILARRQGFCAYWILDAPRMSDYMFAYLRANAAERAELPPPFGVIESSDAMFARVALPQRTFSGATSIAPVLASLRTLWFQPSIMNQNGSNNNQGPSGIPRGVHVRIFESSATRLIHPSPAQYREILKEASAHNSMPSIRFAYAVANRSDDTGGSGDVALTASSCLIPSTPIYELIRDKSRILEAQVNLAQAEGAAIQGAVILGSNRPNYTRGSRMPQTGAPDGLLDNDDQLSRELGDASREEMLTFDRWQERLLALLRMQNPDYDRRGEGEKTSTDRHRLAYGRPARFETILPLNDGIAATHVTEPKVLSDLATMQTKYCEDVAELLNVVPPRTLIQTATRQHQALRGGTTSSFERIMQQRRETPLDNHLQHVVQNERNWISALFSDMYALGFHDLDMQAIDELAHSVQQERLRMSEAKLAVRALEHELKIMGARVDPHLRGSEAEAEADAAKTEAFEKKLDQLKEKRKEAGSKGERQTVRARAKRVREWFEYLRTRPDAVAKLEFHPGMAQRNAIQIEALVEMLGNGLVDAASVQPYFDSIFPGVQVKNPPQPEKAGPGGAVAKKK